jgi:hypothetical protein
LVHLVVIVAFVAGIFGAAARPASASDIMPGPRSKQTQTSGDIMPGPRAR